MERPTTTTNTPPARSPAWLRRAAFWSGSGDAYDVVIIGGGVQGACLYHRLVGEGHRALLVDRGDFGSGTSQASAMLVWGGLLYLKNLDVAEVVRLCRARDRLLDQHADQVALRHVTVLFGHRPHRSPLLVYAWLWLYWLLAMGRRGAPARVRCAGERAFLRDASIASALRFEEAHLVRSDAQFVFDWIRLAADATESGASAAQSDAVNYCEAAAGRYDPRARRWTLELLDPLGGRARTVTARWVVNAAGVWVDGVHAQFRVDSPWQHLLAKGASITIDRPTDHRDALVFDGRGTLEGMSLVPWGPVSLWGSTETLIASPDDGATVDADDVSFLLDALNRHVAVPRDQGDVVALRCGVRPLVVRRGQVSGDPLTLSKRACVWRDPHRPWVAIYGGKLTACQHVADRVAGLLRVERGAGSPRKRSVARLPFPRASGERDEPCAGGEQIVPTERFAGIDVPSPAWCREHQMCWTLSDYLRRRTNVAQWVHRGGLGRDGEHRQRLLRVACAFTQTAGESACAQVAAYERRIAREHDDVLAARPQVECVR